MHHILDRLNITSQYGDQSVMYPPNFIIPRNIETLVVIVGYSQPKLDLVIFIYCFQIRFVALESVVISLAFNFQINSFLFILVL